MKNACFIALAAAVVLAGGCSSGESYHRVGYDFSTLNRVAIGEVAGGPQGELAKNQIGDFFVGQLLKKGYAPVERAQVQAILKEQEFQASDLTSPENVARAGQILNVDAILVVNIPKFGQEISMTAKLLDVEDGSILWYAPGSGKVGTIYSTIFGAAGGAAAGAAVAGSGDRAAGAVIGGVLGGVAGHALSPQEADKAQEIIRKMCKGMPYRVKP
ncbi:MAG TPA: CsgG/HfaB family protein [Sedimentisphaerales bacterium]|nr:CsgG/HfaB family protein [Sedimentisphaerales bacterium]